MTSIEWLQGQLNPDMKTMQGNIIQGLLEQAKEMHKQEIINAFKSGLKSPYHQDYTFVTQDNQKGTKSEQYYQETFGREGRNETVTNCHDFEISDEEIEKAIVSDYIDHYAEGFINGAKWYREQLKQRNESNNRI